MKKAFIPLALLPLAVALAADPPTNAHPWKQLDQKDISIEDLGHSFFFHSDWVPERLAAIISEAGIDRLKPALAEHSRNMKHTGKLAAKLRQVCRKLQGARSGAEFAAAFIEAEERDQHEKQQAVRNILSTLNADDRKALENYLDTEFRRGAGRSRLDYEAMFASGPFPSTETTALAKKACDGAAEAEARVEP